MESSRRSTAPKVDTRARQARPSKGAEIIKQRIKQGIYKPGEQLPSLRTLSNELKLSLPSVQRAVQQLEREAIVESRHGVGIRILDGAHCDTTPFVFGFVQPYFSRFSVTIQHYLEQALDSRSNLCIVKSTHNSPERERQEIERLINNDVNGLLIWPVEGDTNGAFLREVGERLPVVFVDRTLDDVPERSVVLNFAEGGRNIVHQLHKNNYRRILLVCDPADISSFKQLKAGMREAVAELENAIELDILDYPVVRLIEAAYESDYQITDSCYETLAPILRSGQYDVMFCPHSEFYDQVFVDTGHPETLDGIHCVALHIPDGPPHSRRYQQLGIEEWILDISGMIVRALDTLQDVVLTRSAHKGTIWLPLYQKEKPLPRVSSRP